ncbi:MAG: lysophospholipid acyltransferase family protein [Nannocystaceae bacterium]
MNRGAVLHLDGRARPWRSLATMARCGQTLLAESRRPPPRPSVGRHRERAELLQRLAASICDQHRVIVRVHGEPPRRPSILVANHLSYLDPVVLLSLAPALPIAKAELAEWPILGRWIEATGALFVDRGRVASGVRILRGALEILRSGGSILNFPEGTTTAGDRILPFRRGIFGLARLAGVDVVPVKITYDSPELAWVGDDAFLPHYLRVAGRSLSTAFVAFRPPIAADRGDADALARLARAALLSPRSP